MVEHAQRIGVFRDTSQSLVDSCNGPVAWASKLTGGVSDRTKVANPLPDLPFEFRSLNSLLRVVLRNHAAYVVVVAKGITRFIITS